MLISIAFFLYLTYMSLVKDHIEGSTSDIEYNSNIHPKVINSSVSDMDMASNEIQNHINEQSNNIKNLSGIHTSSQSGGTKDRQYIVMDTKIECPMIISDTSRNAAIKAFKLIREHLKIKKRKLIIWDVKLSRRYKYSLIKGKIKREKL